MTDWRSLGSLAFAAGLAVGAAAGCGQKSAESTPSGAGTQVLVTAANIAVVESRRLEAGVTFTGELVPAEIVEVNARFDGDLEAVVVREGQRVRRGQPLARYKPREMTDAMEAARAAVQAAEADRVAAESAVRRARRLIDAGAMAPSNMEITEAQLKAAEARVRGAQAALATAEENTAKLDVPSPLDAIVSRVVVHSGDRTAVGDPLMTLVDTRILELSVTVPSEKLSSVGPGTPIEFEVDAYPGEKFTGTVDRLNPTTEPGTRQVRVYTRIPNPDGRLMGGLFASGRLISQAKDKAVAAPVATLRREGGEVVVYRLHGGIAERLPVHTGLVDEQANVVELDGAVALGDSLLTGVLPGLRSGATVRILATSGAATSTPTMDSETESQPGVSAGR